MIRACCRARFVTNVDNSPMVVLRPTRKLHAMLPPTTPKASVSDTALGDWYMNRLVVDRRPLLLLVSSASLLPLLIPARDVRALPMRLPELLAARLRQLGVVPGVISAELAAMANVAVAPTLDRSVLGIMVDFTRVIPSMLSPNRWNDATLGRVAALLAETPCFANRAGDGVVFPERTALAVLAARWAATG